MLRMRQTLLDKCRPTPVLTDRRSLNRARPPPIYLQREEAITPGVYPKVVLRKKNLRYVKHNDNLPTVSSSTQVQDTKKNQIHDRKSSITQYRRRVVSEDYIKNQQTPSQSVNPLQTRLSRAQRNSSGLRKTASDRVAAGTTAGGSLLMTRTLTQANRNVDVCNRDLVSTGYAQLRSRTIVKSSDETKTLKPIRKNSGLPSPSKTAVRLPTISSPPMINAVAAGETPLSQTSPSKSALAPLM